MRSPPHELRRRVVSLWLAAAAAPYLATATAAAPAISELMANNGSTLDDTDGDSTDWIEIHNPDATAVDLGGHSLTDDPATPQKWSFPAGTNLAPGAYLIVFASGKDRAVAGQQLHTNFSLSSGGDYLALVAPDGSTSQAFSPTFPPQKRDVSYGTGNEGTVAYLDPPTPGAANGPPLSGFVADTVFSHKRGFFDSPISVAITSATEGASVRYTIDGSMPTPTRGTPYTGPVAVNSTTVLRAVAFKSGMVPTNVDAQSYLFAADIINQPTMNSAITTSPQYSGEIQGSLQALPVVSLSFDNGDLFGSTGIHSNPFQSGRASEREIHFEFFDPAAADDSTHEPGGIRIHGGNSRSHPKKAFRIYFRSDYGKPRLKHALFPGSPVGSFKHLLLRGSGHDAWTFAPGWDQATFIRNEFLHRLQLAMGQPSPRGRFVNLFLNGRYWGLYELQELPYAHFNADHHGGQPEDWDVVKHGQEVEGGNRAAWDTLMAMARAGVRDDAAYTAIQEHIDIGHFADAMIQRIWSNDHDWLGPFFLNGTDVTTFGSDKNWYVGRRSRGAATGKFLFYSWDAEMSMGIPFAGARSFEHDFTRVNNDGSPGAIYAALRNHPEFRLRFADRLHKHMFNGGAMTPPRLQAMWDTLADRVRSPVVAESARWGLSEELGGQQMTRDGHWAPAAQWVRSQFLVNRSSTVLGQFRSIGLYPNVGAPALSPHGASSTTPTAVSMSSATGGATIYFTTDGRDPRTPGSVTPLVLVAPDSTVQAIVPTAAMDTAIGTTWRNLADPANIASWTTGANGVGYESNPASATSYTPLIKTNLAGMEDINPSAYIRVRFDIADQATLSSITTLSLRLRYDDGFIAYLNGTQIESANASTSNWNSAATTSHSDQAARSFISFDQTDDIGLLRVGQNVLAIHGLNRAADSSDFLIQATLEASTGDSAGEVAAGAQEYSGALTLDQSAQVKARARSADGTWSALTEASYFIGTPASADNLTPTEIHYHPAAPATAGELAASTDQDDFEFIELYNKGAAPIDLSGCSFSRGIDFDFPPGPPLAAGGRALLVSNRAAFLSRYGAATGTAVLGEFANSTKLSNKGERLTLLAANGSTIFDLRFDDKAPWPPQADGSGPGLALIDPQATPNSDLGTATRWRASLLEHGAPGIADDMSFALWTRRTYGPLRGTDTAIAGELVSPPNAGGLPNIVLYAQGWDPGDGDPAALATASITTVGADRFLSLRYQIRNGLSDIVATPKASGNLTDWTTTTVPVSQTPNSDGTTTLTVRDHIPLSTAGERFLHLHITTR